MLKKFVIGICVLFILSLCGCIWCYRHANVQMVCIPATQHLNDKKYRVVHTDTVATEPFLTLRVYYVERRNK